MSPKHTPEPYTMPLKQLLKLLETTADDSPRRARRSRARTGTKPSAKAETPEPKHVRP